MFNIDDNIVPFLVNKRYQTDNCINFCNRIPTVKLNHPSIVRKPNLSIIQTLYEAYSRMRSTCESQIASN